jgi:Uma2 family endonuclease
MATNTKPFITPEEYLHRERAAVDKSEYLKGEIFAMPGGSQNHSAIATNITIEFGIGLRSQRRCRVFNSDFRIYSLATGLYTYADVLVVCGQPQTYETDNLLNPTIVFEVLSPSTQSYDRGDKFMHYRSIPSVSEYVLVAQERVFIEHWTAAEQKRWTLIREYQSLEDTVALLSIAPVALAVEDIYRDIQF